MSDRIVGILLAIAGVLAVATMALLGFDAWRAARTGPHWRRRLLHAGLALLAAVGVPACGSGAEPQPPVTGQTPADPTPLPDTPEWKHVEATWREASEVATGKRGPYPFDRAGKEKLLAELKKALAGVEALHQRAALGDAAAGLLKQDLVLLEHGVQEKRPTEIGMEKASCYEAMALRPVEDSMTRLSARLPLLENLAADAKVQPHVVGKVIATVERDIATLGDDKLTSRVPEPDRLKAESIRTAAAALVAKLRAALPQLEGGKPK